ncbi:DUF4232 domain-containing protein [Streptomyces sp. NPDC006645]|uniref:DUF4232 domain-containing protein n=1 Tax=unclassified Streptomyces TaxID=2593676 RepID=UPI0033B4DDD6
MTRRHRHAAPLAGAFVLLLAAAGCSDLKGEIDAERGGGAAPSGPVSPEPLSPSYQQYGSPPPSAPPSAGAKAAGCPPSGLDAVIGGENAAMGLRVITVKLWNCGDKPYRVKGYPGIELLDEGREPIDVTITHGEDRPRQLTLAPNGTARTNLEWNNRVTSLDGAPTPGAHILVTPAPGEEPISLPLGVDLGSEATLDVTAWAVDPVSGR